MNRQYTNAAELATAWLHGENAYQFGKSDALFASRQQRLESLMGKEVVQKWHLYRLFENGGEPEQASQRLMKVAGAARAAVVIDAQYHGWSPEEAQRISWNCLESYKPGMRHEAYTSALNSPDIAGAMACVDGLQYTYENRQRAIRPGFVHTMGFAVAHLVEMQELTGEMELPEPGHNSGDIISWRPEPTVTADQ